MFQGDVQGSVSNVGNYNSGIIAHSVQIETMIQANYPNFKLNETLKSLPMASDDSSWKSSRGCLQGTRTGLLNELREFINKPDGERVYWLNGPPGSGKTAIANQLARQCKQDKLFLTTFFFSLDSEELNTPRKLFTTFVRQLAKAHPAYAQHVGDAIDADPTLLSDFSTRQFDELLVELANVIPSEKPHVLIIDALDECEDVEELRVLLDVLKNSVPKLPPSFRVFVTSRSTPLIATLSSSTHIVTKSLKLDDTSNLADVDVYIRRTLAHAAAEQGWLPDKELVLAFIKAAGGLFIWVSTVFAYLLRPEAFEPEKDLRELLGESPSPRLRANAEAQMDDLYARILTRLDWQHHRFTKAYQAVLGIILVAKEPLSLSALMLINPKIEFSTFTSTLGQLRAVLLYSTKDPSQPIRILHQSFRDFMLKRVTNPLFSLDLPRHTECLTLFCFDTLNTQLKQPIPGMGYLDGKDKSKGIPHPAEGSISEELSYACRFWVDHYRSLSDPLVGQKALHQLISGHFVRWIEVLACQGSFLGAELKFVMEMKNASAAETFSPAGQEPPERPIKRSFKRQPQILLKFRRSFQSARVKADLHKHTADAKTHAAVTSHLVAMLTLSQRLSFENRRHEGLTIAQIIAEEYEQLNKTNPAAFNVDFAGSLNNLSLRESGMGLREEALESIKRAVDLYQQLATANPVAFNADLAGSLNNLSLQQSEMGLLEEALESIKRAVDLYQQLAAVNPAAFNADFAGFLNNLSLRESGMGLREEALESIKRAVDLYQQLATANPGAFNADLALSLNNLSLRESGMGLREEALESIKRAVDLYQQLVTANPGAFNADLAHSLNNISLRESGMGLREEALESIKRAVDLYQQLATANPVAFNADLAGSLNNLSLQQSEMGLREEALESIKRAVDLYQQLATANPVAFNADLAGSLNNLSLRESGMGLREEALESIKRAVDLYQQLAAVNPAAFNADFAGSLNNISLRESGMGLREEALESIKRAVDLYQQLATANPGAFNAGLAHSLNNLSVQQSDMGLQEEALESIKRAVDLYQQLATANPGAFNADLALSLNNLSLRESEMGLREEALESIKRAVDLYQQLATANPGAFNADLALSLNNLSLRESGMGLLEEALESIKRAVDLYQQLAAVNPAAFNAYLADSLNNLSVSQSDMGLREEALESIERAINIHTDLATQVPAVFQPHLNRAIACREAIIESWDDTEGEDSEDSVEEDDTEED